MTLADLLMQRQRAAGAPPSAVMPQEMGVALPGPGPSAGPPAPERGQPGMRDRIGAALMGMGGQGQLGQMLLQRRQHELDDEYDRLMKIHMGQA